MTRPYRIVFGTIGGRRGEPDEGDTLAQVDGWTGIHTGLRFDSEEVAIECAKSLDDVFFPKVIKVGGSQ